MSVEEILVLLFLIFNTINLILLFVQGDYGIIAISANRDLSVLYKY